jgi:tRNA U38,U39,U40 pseudouridine synthase TruA
MNATAAISKAFLDGRVLSIKTAFRDFGITNLPREVSRLIEKKFDVQITRVPRNGKTRYGVHARWFEYRLPKTEYNKSGIEKMRQYVIEQYGAQEQKSSDINFKDRNQIGLYD